MFHDIRCSACNRVIAFTDRAWYTKSRPIFSCVDCYFKSIKSEYEVSKK